ncbi:hypothetical protein [Nocardia asteroides]|uniref:hypothetical protein n=1 Tax=Nocardia asteroides TaxID=1824 RepID=UPI0033D0AA6E
MTAPARHWIETATLVLAKCSATDLWFPNASDAAVLAWAHEFSTSRLDRADLLAGVSRAYRVEPDGYRPTPASLIRHGRAAYLDALRELPDERRAELDRVIHELQDIGVPIPLAHRTARCIALRRPWRDLLNEDQAAALTARMTAPPKALTANPPRELAETLAPYRRMSGNPPRHALAEPVQPFRSVA